MSQVTLCLLWHFHQPCYWDCVKRVFVMPWVRLHGIKDYSGMALLLEGFPGIRCTVNFSPVLLDQIDRYAQGDSDIVQRLCLKMPRELSEEEVRFLRRQLFLAHPDQMIGAHARFQGLQKLVKAGASLDEHDWIDLETISNLSWFHSRVVAQEGTLSALIAKGEGFSVEDRNGVLGRQRKILGMVIDRWRSLAQKKQIEISMSPYYHPIVPLLCDSNVVREAQPWAMAASYGTQLRDDARVQVQRALSRGKDAFGVDVGGMWPSEGAVGTAACELMASQGVKWVASDEGVLSRSLETGHPEGTVSDKRVLYRPYQLAPEGPLMVFRDQILSNLVGFTYKTWAPETAARDFVERVASAPDGSLVTVVLDGENPWEHYSGNGVHFLHSLYSRLSENARIKTSTISDALRGRATTPVKRVWPGSWINQSLAVWAGHDEDRRAWDLLARVRESIRGTAVPEAWESLYAAEGSDWFWWFGDDFSTPQDSEFDALFRRHLGNACHLAGVQPPEELKLPIKPGRRPDFIKEPQALLRVTLDGQNTDYFEWAPAGVFDTAMEFGVMAGTASFLKTVRFGVGESQLFIRLDCAAGIRPCEALRDHCVRLALIKPRRETIDLLPPASGVTTLLGEIVECSASLERLGVSGDVDLEFFIEIEQRGGIPVQFPALAPLRVRVPSEEVRKAQWQV